MMQTATQILFAVAGVLSIAGSVLIFVHLHRSRPTSYTDQPIRPKTPETAARDAGL